MVPVKTEKVASKTQMTTNSSQTQQFLQAPANSASTVTASNYSDGQLAALVTTCGENDRDEWSTMILLLMATKQRFMLWD